MTTQEGAIPMKLLELFETLRTYFGERADPDTWWPIYYGRTLPPEFERAITNLLVTRASWSRVRGAVDRLDQVSLLTAEALAEAREEVIASCLEPAHLGLQAQRATWLRALGEFVVQRFGTEAGFCEQVTREELLGIPGIGDESADRILLYTCGRLIFS